MEIFNLSKNEIFLTKIKHTNYNFLDELSKSYIKKLFFEFAFSHQELKQIIDFSIDFKMWNEKKIYEIPLCFDNKKQAFNHLRNIWQNLKEKTNSYANFNFKYQKKDYKIEKFKTQKISLGNCPVASKNTRCCNLLTLDAVNSCGFDCSYCSIQSFYHEGKIGFDENFSQNLQNLKLDKTKTYHIGTGQSSDSLMWGNKNKILSSLTLFAKQNQNVILEFKTKSNNINFLLNHEIPKNIICTFSISTPTIWQNEEHLTASNQSRLDSAKKLHDKGILVGFHFHPMIIYDEYKAEYSKTFNYILNNFNPNFVALVSFGTLTFIKPVISKIRQRNFKSKVLQMPFTEINNKFSYPYDMKKDMFSFAYNSFKPWHKKVYFYLCMEDKNLWNDVFNYEYQSNEEMEKDMKNSYFKKINALKNK